MLHISGDVALVDHVMSHEGVSGVHMMSPPAQAIEPIEPSSTATATDILLKQHKPHHMSLHNINVQSVNNILCVSMDSLVKEKCP